MTDSISLGNLRNADQIESLFREFESARELDIGMKGPKASQLGSTVARVGLHAQSRSAYLDLLTQHTNQVVNAGNLRMPVLAHDLALSSLGEWPDADRRRAGTAGMGLACAAVAGMGLGQANPEQASWINVGLLATMHHHTAHEAIGSRSPRQTWGTKEHNEYHQVVSQATSQIRWRHQAASLAPGAGLVGDLPRDRVNAPLMALEHVREPQRGPLVKAVMARRCDGLDAHEMTFPRLDVARSISIAVRHGLVIPVERREFVAPWILAAVDRSTQQGKQA